MEATMEQEGSYRPIGFGRAMSEQIRFLWISRRPLLMVVGLLGILALSGEPWSDHPMARMFTLWPLWMVVVPAFWAFAVWHGEGPSNRLYFWTQPVSRTGQSLARVAAGAIWLVVIYLVLLAAGAVFAAVDGELTQFSVVGSTAWTNLFLGPLLVYMGISILTVPSDYPIRWFIGILFGVPIVLSLLAEWLGQDAFVRTILEPLGATWGIAAAVVGPFVAAMMRLDGHLDGRAVDPEALGQFFVAGTWWVAMPLWLLLVTGIVVALASRHPDRYPSVRRLG